MLNSVAKGWNTKLEIRNENVNFDKNGATPFRLPAMIVPKLLGHDKTSLVFTIEILKYSRR